MRRLGATGASWPSPHAVQRPPRGSTATTGARTSSSRVNGHRRPVLSPDAKDSEWVSEELNYARIHKLRVFTVLVRGDESNAIPFGLTGVQWVDMRADYDEGMKEIMQQTALDQLVTAVREHLGR